MDQVLAFALAKYTWPSYLIPIKCQCDEFILRAHDVVCASLFFGRRKAFWVAKQVLQLGMGDAFDDWLIEKIQLLRKGSVVASGFNRLEQVPFAFKIFTLFSHFGSTISFLLWYKN